MYIRIWNEGEFMSVLNSGLYEDLIHQCEQWMEQNYIITRSKVPEGIDYAQAKRVSAIGVITQEGKQIWEHDRSNYYDSYAKIIGRIEERRKKGLIYKVKGGYVSSSSSTTTFSSNSTSTSSSSSGTQTNSSYESGGSGCSPFGLIMLLVLAVGLVFLWLEVFTVRVSMVTDKTVVSEMSQQTTYEYDWWGKLIQVAEYNENGVMIACTQYEYDSIGEPQGSVTYAIENGEQIKISSNKYEVSPFFYITEDQQFNADGQKTDKVYTGRNIRGLTTQVIVYSGTEPIRRSEFEYDGKTLIKQIDYGYTNGEEYETAVYEYSYDEDKNIVSCAAYADGVLISETVYTYAGGLVAEELNYLYNDMEKILIGKTVYAYDSNKHLEKTTVYQNDVAVEYTQYQCDENGNIIEAAHYYENAEEADETVTYQYLEKRMRVTKAKRLQRERGEEFVIIDKGWF